MSTDGYGVGQRVAAYYAAIRAMDVEAWMAAFASDAVVHNPVGAAPVSGHQALRELSAALSGSLDEIGLRETCVLICASSAAVKWVGHGVAWTGNRVLFEGIDVLEIDDDARIGALWSYWDPAALRAQLHRD